MKNYGTRTDNKDIVNKEDLQGFMQSGTLTIMINGVEVGTYSGGNATININLSDLISEIECGITDAKN